MATSNNLRPLRSDDPLLLQARKLGVNPLKFYIPGERGKSQRYNVSGISAAISSAINRANKLSANAKQNEAEKLKNTLYKMELDGLKKPKNVFDAINNYSVVFSLAQRTGVQKLSATQKKDLAAYARSVRDFDSEKLGTGLKNLIKTISGVQDAINSIDNQQQLVNVQKKRVQSLSGDAKESARARLASEEDTLARLINQANQTAPSVQESFSRVGISDLIPGVGAEDKRISQLDEGLAAFAGSRVFRTGELAGRLNTQLTDSQILNDINTARKNEYKKLYDIGVSASTDLQSQIDQITSAIPSLSGSQRTTAQSTLASLKKQLSEVRADTLQAQNLYTRYRPISGAEATSAIGRFRESLRLPEQRTLDQIKEIDPKLFETITQLGEQYRTMATSQVGPTTAESTEALRRQTEESIAAQLQLGSQLGAEEQRQYQQAARAAQAARGNIFGVAPAVEEAVTTGLAGEQRLAARLGAAQGFLSSGQSVSDALARDVSLRNALQQSRLGAASEFAAAGPSAYNLASQRAAQQQALLQQYVGAATQQAAGQTGGFQAQQGQMVPYAYVNPQAGFLGAQNAAKIYGDLANYAAETYGAQTRAIASTYTSPSQAFGNIASGLGNMFSFSGKLPFCWVAREVYGAENPKWLQFREWMLTKASDNLRNFYIEYGERIAESIRNKPRIKAIIRKWMDSKIG